MQYLLAKMLVATERLIHLSAIPHRMECPQENMTTESIPSFNCSPHGGDDSDRHVFLRTFHSVRNGRKMDKTFRGY